MRHLEWVPTIIDYAQDPVITRHSETPVQRAAGGGRDGVTIAPRFTFTSTSWLLCLSEKAATQRIQEILAERLELCADINASDAEQREVGRRKADAPSVAADRACQEVPWPLRCLGRGHYNCLVR